MEVKPIVPRQWQAVLITIQRNWSVQFVQMSMNQYRYGFGCQLAMVKDVVLNG